MKTQIKRMLRQRFRLIFSVFLFACLLPSPATANITVAEYMSLRAQAQQGNQGANARWRYYVIGVMDGMQSVHAPATARDADLHFCMPSDFAVSPKFFDGFYSRCSAALRKQWHVTATVEQPHGRIYRIGTCDRFSVRRMSD